MEPARGGGASGVRAIPLTVTLAGVALAAAACGSPSGPVGYLYSAPSGVLYMQWQPDQSGNGIQGTMTEDGTTGTAPSETISVTTVPITGSINGSSVVIRPQGLLSTGTLNGTLNGNSLTFSVVTSSGSIQPGTLTQADTAAYNAAVASFRARIRQDNVEAARAQHAQQVIQQDQQDQQKASNDLATLQQVSFSSDIGNLSSDVNQINSDLTTEKSDAAAGPNSGGQCYNLTSNVDYDVQSNVDYDIQSNLGYDLQTNLIPDIQSVRQDISAMKGDQTTLASDGVAAPSGAAAAISSVQAAISHAISTANNDIDQANAVDAQAYAIANNMATGACSGDGLGSPPAPVAHIH
jgi:hypothetical protein